MDIINDPIDESCQEQPALKDIPPKISQVEGLIQALASISVPPLMGTDDHGRYLQAQREAAQQKLRAGVQELEGYLPVLDREISRCRHNLDRIRVDGQKLNRPEAGEKYSAAEQKQQQQYRKAVAMRQKVLSVLRKAERAGGGAGSKNYPGEEPGQSDPLFEEPPIREYPEPMPPPDDVAREPDGTLPPEGPIPPGAEFPFGPTVIEPGLDLDDEDIDHEGGDDDDEVEGMISTGPLE